MEDDDGWDEWADQMVQSASAHSMFDSNSEPPTHQQERPGSASSDEWAAQQMAAGSDMTAVKPEGDPIWKILADSQQQVQGDGFRVTAVTTTATRSSEKRACVSSADLGLSPSRRGQQSGGSDSHTHSISENTERTWVGQAFNDMPAVLMASAATCRHVQTYAEFRRVEQWLIQKHAGATAAATTTSTTTTNATNTTTPTTTTPLNPTATQCRAALCLLQHGTAVTYEWFMLAAGEFIFAVAAYETRRSGRVNLHMYGESEAAVHRLFELAPIRRSGRDGNSMLFGECEARLYAALVPKFFPGWTSVNHPCITYELPPSAPLPADIAVGKVLHFELGGQTVKAHLDWLALADAETINTAWPYRSSDSPYMIPLFIRCGPCVGIRLSATGQLVAWALVYPYGSIGMLHTEPDFRGKSLAKAVVCAIANEQRRARPTIPPFAHITASNTASRNLFSSIGFLETETIDDWHYLDPPAD